MRSLRHPLVLFLLGIVIGFTIKSMWDFYWLNAEHDAHMSSDSDPQRISGGKLPLSTSIAATTTVPTTQTMPPMTARADHTVFGLDLIIGDAPALWRVVARDALVQIVLDKDPDLCITHISHASLRLWRCASSIHTFFAYNSTSAVLSITSSAHIDMSCFVLRDDHLSMGTCASATPITMPIPGQVCPLPLSQAAFGGSASTCLISADRSDNCS
jgi:hypothetical protein